MEILVRKMGRTLSQCLMESKGHYLAKSFAYYYSANCNYYNIKKNSVNDSTHTKQDKCSKNDLELVK